MFLSYLKWTNFRNLVDGYIELKKGLFVLKGKNGAGKTNFMESIFFLCKGISFKSGKGRDLLQWGKEYTRVEGKIGDHINEVYLDSKKKIIKIDKKRVNKISDYYGRYGVVPLLHRDIDLFSSRRSLRFFFNTLIAHFYPLYIDYLASYRNLLKQRNSALKKRMIKVIKSIDTVFLDAGMKIYEMRVNFIKEFLKYVNSIDKKIISDRIEIGYEKTWSDFAADLNNYMPADLNSGYTTKGPHRDSFFIKKGEVDVKYLSTGERALLIILLKMAETLMYRDKKGSTPLLMIDEIMNFLDAEKKRYVYDIFYSSEQIFVTGDFDNKDFYKKFDKSMEITLNEGKVFKTW